MIGIQVSKVLKQQSYDRPEYADLQADLYRLLAGDGANMSAAARARIWEICDVLDTSDPYTEFFNTFGESITVTSAGISVTVNLINL
ncbi:hypothetical protein CPT_Slocum_017 [Serratia phage Slocum]|nr:hypothetical protein CPT_Slocum_017 [Serratia phage Slocum]